MKQLLLDPENPGIGDGQTGRSQADLMTIMVERFNIDELAESILTTGFKPFDPIVGYWKGYQVVVREGNRRTATLKLLLDPTQSPPGKKAEWKQRADRVDESLRKQITSVEVTVYDEEHSEEVDAYVGFRHVTGVLKWEPEERAKYVADLIDRYGWGYEEIAERLGS